MKFLFLGLLTALSLRTGKAGSDYPVQIVSKSRDDIDLCLSVVNSVGVIVKECDFGNPPDEQIWIRYDDERLATASAENSCLTANGPNLFMGDCAYRGDVVFPPVVAPPGTDHTIWRFKEDYDSSACIGPEGSAPPNDGEDVILRACEDSVPDSQVDWSFHYVECTSEDSKNFNSFRFCGDGGCLRYMEDGDLEPVEYPELSDVWLFDQWFDDALCFGTGQLRLGRDPSKCLQQDGNNAGAELIVQPCDCNNKLQQFACYEPQKPRLNTDLCMGFIDPGVFGLVECADSNADVLASMQVYFEDAYPMTLLVARDNYLSEILQGQPRVVAYDFNSYPESWICMVQQGDGNMRILRSPSPEACMNNQGDFIYHTSVSWEGQGYRTKLQRDGNWVTYQGSGQFIWKSHSSMEDDNNSYRVVLEEDQSISIYRKIDDSNPHWNSKTDSPIFYDRPLVLMRSHPNNPKQVNQDAPIEVNDELAGTKVCVFQQGDGNLRILRGNDCKKNQGTLIFHSGYSDPSSGSGFYTFLQRDGNLVTRERGGSDPAVGSTCSAGEQSDYFLAITQYDSVDIRDEQGRTVWDSKHDDNCF